MQDIFQAMTEEERKQLTEPQRAHKAQEDLTKAQWDMIRRERQGYQPSPEEKAAGQKLFNTQEFMAAVKAECRKEYAGLSPKDRRARTKSALKEAAAMVRRMVGAALEPGE